MLQATPIRLHPFRLARLLPAALILIVCSSVASAQAIDPSRGVDARVDYRALTEIGPWDDRNYQLTQDDLALLSDNESELRQAIPAFYRVQLRKQIPNLLTEGPVQYPHSAMPHFYLEHGGYLIDGQYYRGVERRDNKFHVLRERGVEADSGAEAVAKFLEGEVRVTNPNAAAESSININPVNPDLVIAGSNGPGGGQRQHWSNDGGETWTQVDLPMGGTCCDPTQGWSSDGTKAYAATLAGNFTGNWFYRSADGGQTWEDLATIDGDPRREIGGSGADKEFLHVDLSPTSPHLDNIYLTWHESNILRFSRSTDMGHTWSAPIAFDSTGDQRGIGSDITTDAAGNIYYFWAAFNSRKIWVRKSTNGGMTFDPSVEVASTEASFNFFIPSQDIRGGAIICSADTDRSSGTFAGSVYAAWADLAPVSGNHARVQVAYSRDGGDTWTVTTPHEVADVNEVDRWQPWLAVAPDGSVHVIFNDTRNDPTRRSIDLYHNFSTDGGQTWGTPQRLTSETSPHLEDGFQFGDYSGLDIVMDQAIA
ncbi:MAG: sialidase family protein, partial [Acidobacteriota bacterium]